MISDDTRFMALALQLGQRGLGQVWPNPAVGAVIVVQGRIVGRGWTQPGGRPHAETMALAQAGDLARGATAYVSLEPCAHHGKTPPCAQALISAGITRVVSAIQDPDSRVGGRGHAMLRAAGVEVTTGVLATQAAESHLGFFTRITQARPMVTLKLALSLDGRIATAAGESRWITGPQARARVHLMRAQHDAVLVGAGTARADDPHLGVRGLGIAAQPVRVVASAGLDLPQGGALAASAAEGRLWLLHGAGLVGECYDFWQAQGARLLPVALGPDGALAVGAMLGALAGQGIGRVFCEGGGALAAGLLQAGFVDRLAIFHAGLMLGAGGRAGVGPLADQPLALFDRFELAGTEVLGPDVLNLWRKSSAV